MASSAPKNFARRDKLLEIEGKAQAKWEAAKAHEEDAPESGGALLRNSLTATARAHAQFTARSARRRQVPRHLPVPVHERSAAHGPRVLADQVRVHGSVPGEGSSRLAAALMEPDAAEARWRALTLNLVNMSSKHLNKNEISSSKLNWRDFEKNN